MASCAIFPRPSNRMQSCVSSRAAIPKHLRSKQRPTPAGSTRLDFSQRPATPDTRILDTIEGQRLATPEAERWREWGPYLSERQWAQIGTSSTYRTALQNAWARKSYGSKHPLFSGEPILWNGILVRKLPKYCIRFLPSDTAKVITSANRYTATESDQTVNASLTSGYGVDRAILVGAQALGYVYGANSQSGTGFAWLERKYNFERNLEVAGESMGGMAKLRFKFDDGSGNKEPTDNGVFVFDSAVKL